MCGTGTEDYIGTGWGQGRFAHLYQGCSIADYEGMTYCFYRYHIPDPVFFSQSLRGVMQQIGGSFGDGKRWLRERGETVIGANAEGTPADLSEDGPRHILFEREENWSSCAYFYGDKPACSLPPLLPYAERL